MMQNYLLQIVLIVAGLILFICTIHSLAKKVITESMSLFWSAMSVLFVLAGILLIPVQWNRYITPGALSIVAVCFILVFAGMFYLSVQLSCAIRKIQELAVQVSLLNQEHIKVDYHLSNLSGQGRNEIWRTNTIAEHPQACAKKGETVHEECIVCN